METSNVNNNKCFSDQHKKRSLSCKYSLFVLLNVLKRHLSSAIKKKVEKNMKRIPGKFVFK